MLVSNGSNFQLTTGTVGGVTHFFVGTADITAQLASAGGSLGGDLTARDQDIPTVMASLDQLAYSVSTQVNALNNAGVNANGATGAAADSSTTGAMTLDIFSPPPTQIANRASGSSDVAGSAASMSVVMTDPNRISAASLGKGTGDNSNAVAMADLAGQSIVNGQIALKFLFELRIHPRLYCFQRPNREHGANCLCNPVTDSERFAFLREPERRSLFHDNAGTQLPGGFAGFFHAQYAYGLRSESGRTNTVS